MRTTWRTSASMAITALALSAGMTSAQDLAPLGAGRSDKVAEIEQQARAATQTSTNWWKASILYRRAAELRAEEPVAAEHYRMAGLLAYYARHTGTAVEDLTRAGEAALAWGDVAFAAKAFLDAAWVANRDGDGAQALALVRRGERLAHSPLLARADRAALLSSIGQRPQPPQRPTF